LDNYEKIVSQYRMIYDHHTHTTFSHGKGSIEDNVKVAVQKGLKSIAITDHGPGHLTYGIDRNKIKVMREEVERLKLVYPQIEILLGVEAKKEPTFFAFYDKFISLCNLKGITRTKACTDCGLSRTAWRKWMDGGLPNGMAIGKFAEYFGVSVDELLGIATKNKPLTINGKILSDAEISLIELFRQVSGNRQQLILQMIRVAINNQE